MCRSFKANKMNLKKSRTIRLLTRYYKEKNYIERLSYLKNAAFPYVNSIELDSRCNLKCIFCPRDDDSREQGYMSTELIQEILRHNPESFGHRTLFLHYGGESLLHPQLGKAISILVNHGLNCNLSTNCSALHKYKSKEIIESGLQHITLSMDSLNKEDYEKYRGGKYDQTVKNIIDFLRLKKEKGSVFPITHLQIIETPEARLNLESYLEFWKRYPIDFIHIKGFIGRANQLKGLNTEFVTKQYRGNHRVPCRWFWEMVNITWNGIVNICCHDFQGKLPLGDLRKNTLREIWNSERVLEIRRNHIQGYYDNGLCESCEDFRGHAKGLFSKTAFAKVFFDFGPDANLERIVYARKSTNNLSNGIKSIVKSILN